MATTRIASGRTTPGSTNWQPYNGGTTGVYVDVDTSAAKLTGMPVYITSIGGNSSHWATTGASAVYLATSTGFRVYIRWDDGAVLTTAQAQAFNWHINWIAMEV